MKRLAKRLHSIAPLALLALAALAAAGRLFAESRHVAPPSAAGNVVVSLCDGETHAEIAGVKEGERPTRAQAQAVSDALMAEWRRKNPGAGWDGGPQLAQAVEPPPPQPGGTAPGAAEHGGQVRPGSQAPAPAPAQPGAMAPGAEPRGAAEGAPAAGQRTTEAGRTPGEAGAQGATATGAGGMPAGPQGPVQEGQTYGAFSERDERIWQVATDRFVDEGRRIFHSSDELGGTIAVSCDMCHPDAANTHPETYPKFQVQFGRVALLRDMINWCIENPVRGRPLHDDDPKLKALEAYILAQRKGAPLAYGKH